ncbi:MAG: hypothetical protein GY936_07420 [Ignavibacteriae bacterium]|nr:hypothetical protein [Ignavibacteriota bacterium]
MESFKVDLNPIQKQSKFQPYLLMFGGAFYIIFGIYKLLNEEQSSTNGWFWIIGGIGYLVILYYNRIHSSKYFLEISDTFIQVKQSSFKSSKIEWSNVKLILIKPISIEFQLGNRSKEEISLGNTGYKNVIDIKVKLLEFAKQKNIKVT